MQKAEIISFCDNTECKDSEFFQFKERGKNFFIGVARSTDNSRSDAAAEKILNIVSDSFLRRPSLKDEAFDVITDFANLGVYNMQEPRKRFMAHGAMLLMKQDKARGIISGNGRIYCFCDGKLVLSSEERNYRLIGEKVKYDDSFTETVKISGSVRIVLCCGERELPPPALLEETLVGNPEIDEWTKRVRAMQTWDERFLMLAILPERKRKFKHFGLSVFSK